jgi:hypothetical protein
MVTFISSHKALLVKYERKSQSSTRCYESPLVVQEVSLQKPKVGVWCATSALKIIRTVSFKGTNSRPYVKLILHEFQAFDPVVGNLTSQKGEDLN